MWFTMSLIMNLILVVVIGLMGIRMAEMSATTAEAIELLIKMASYNYFGNSWE